MNNNQNENLSYYPESIFMKDGKITTQSVENSSTSSNNNSNNKPNFNNGQNNSQFNFNNILPLLSGNKNLTDLLPLLLAKSGGNNNMEAMSKLFSNLNNNTNHVNKPENSTENKKITHQNYIDEM